MSTPSREGVAAELSAMQQANGTYLRDRIAGRMHLAFHAASNSEDCEIEWGDIADAVLTDIRELLTTVDPEAENTPTALQIAETERDNAYNDLRRVRDQRNAVEQNLITAHQDLSEAHSHIVAYLDETHRLRAGQELCERNHVGTWPGEIARLRRIEAVLLQLGAPTRSEHGDPGGLTVAWLRERLAPDTPSAFRDGYDTGHKAAARERITFIDHVGVVHVWDWDTSSWRVDSPENAAIAMTERAVRRALDRFAGMASAAVDRADAIRFGHAEQVSPACQQQVGLDGFAPALCGRTLVDGKCLMHGQQPDTPATEDQAGEHDDEPLDPATLSDLLSLVQVTVTPEMIATWTPEERAEAEAWAAALHLNASDNDDVKVPPRPVWLTERAL